MTVDDRVRTRDVPGSPVSLQRGSWLHVLTRTIREFRADNLTDRAAALTYYAVLAMFPALIVFVALLGLFGQYPQTTNALLRIVGHLGPQSAVDTLRGPITSVVRAKGGAGALLGVGLIGAVWSASGYVGAFVRASNAIYEVDEGRRFWKLRPLQIGVTIVMVLMAAIVAIAVVATGPVARAVGHALHIGSSVVLAWEVAKWPVLLVLVLTMFAILYYAAPNVKVPGFRWITPGAVLAIVIWLVASVAFGIYVAAFGSYNKTYGTLGGIIIFLIWMWLSNVALLLGAEFNAELERERELVSGDQSAADRLQLPPRDVPKA